MSMISNYVEKLKASFLPQVDEKARMTIDGTVVVLTNTANGKEWIGLKDGEKVAYPEDVLIDHIPVYTVAKTIDQVKPGDIVKATSSTYAVVESVKGGYIYNTTFGGNLRKNAPVKDFLTQQKTVRVVVNPFAGNMGANNNMMLLMLLDGKEGKGDLAEVMMLASMLGGQNNGNPFANMMNNPAAMIAFSKNDGGSLKDIMMLQMLQGAGFNFGTPVAPVVPTEDPEPAVEA